MRHSAKIALITGATSGIGEAAAKLYAQQGAKVILVGRRQDKLEKLLSEVRQHQPESIAVAADLSIPEDVESLFAEIKNTFGRLDIAINNAGFEGKVAPISFCSLEDFDEVYGINVRGLFLCLKKEVELMLPNNSGNIINVASALGVVGLRYGTLYSGTKHAVVGMTKSLALEVAQKGLRVNVLCPGAVETPLFERTNGENRKLVEAMHPMGRVGTPEEMAQTLSWLGSEEASFMTGSVVLADGGYAAM